MKTERINGRGSNLKSTLIALLLIDVKSAVRDSLLRWMLVIPLLFALVIRYGLPRVQQWAMAQFTVDLGDYDVLIASLLVLMTPMLFGTVIGFLLLDQRDDRTMSALLVTPLSARTYVGYRLGVPMLVGAALTVVSLRLSGCSTVGLWGQCIAAIGAAPLVPLFGLLLAGFARNKVQGFALMKAAGGLNWPPMVAFFVDPPKQWLFGLCPTFWPAKIYWLTATPSADLVGTFSVGLAVMALLVALLWRRVDLVLHR